MAQQEGSQGNAPQRGGKYAALGRDEAGKLLKRRLVGMGGTAGAVMGLASTFFSALFFDWFPPIGAPMFLVLTFIAMLVIGASGALIGKRTYLRIVST